MKSNFTSSFIKTVFRTGLMLLSFSSTVFSQTLDQNQPVYDGGTSERNLAGYYEWQSFTAGMTGSLCRIDLMFCNTNVKVNGTGTLKVYTGQGTAGMLLLTQSVTVNGTAYNFNQPFWQTWNLITTPAITASTIYTFQFIPTIGGGLTDPYLIQINIPSVYAGGQNYNLGSMGDCAFRTYVLAPLPVELVSFKGELIENKIELSWATASEINNDYFEIQNSSNANDFFLVGIVKGNGNSSGTLNYSFEDTHPYKGINYYRLKQVDYNGDVKYSRIIAVMNEMNQNTFSCIVTNENGVYYLDCSGLGNGVVSIFDLQGRLLEEKYFAKSESAMEINFDEYTGELFILKISSGDKTRTIKLVKQN